jgi:hypothetical protein
VKINHSTISTIHNHPTISTIQQFNHFNHPTISTNHPPTKKEKRPGDPRSPTDVFLMFMV